MNKHFVLIFLPHEGFDIAEYEAVTANLIRAGIKYMVISSHFMSACHASGSHDEVVPDITLERVNSKSFSGFIFIGEGPASEFENNGIVRGIIDFALTNDILVAAIGSAVPIVTRSKLARGLRVAAKPMEKRKVESAGAYYSGSAVEKSRQVITANGPGAAKEFADTILSTLLDENNFEGREYLR